VVKAMLTMKNDKKGKELLEVLNLQGIESASDSDWDDIRRLPF